MYIMAFAFNGSRATATFSSKWIPETPVTAHDEPDENFAALWTASLDLEAKTADPVYWLATEKRISRKGLENLIALTDDLPYFLQEECILFDASEDDEDDLQVEATDEYEDEDEIFYLDDQDDGLEPCRPLHS